MATFTFDETNGTTLEAIDSKWEGDTTGLVTADGKIRPSAAYAQRHVRYENSHGAYQSSKGSFKALTSPAAEELAGVCIHKTGGGGTGYDARVGSSQHLYLYRSGSYVGEYLQTDFPLSDFEIEITTTDAGGGSKYVKVYLAGVERISYTDASPLTTGYPGFFMYAGANGVASCEMYTWTDGVAAAASAPKRSLLLGIG